MTSFVHTTYSMEHPGVERAEQVAANLHRMAAGFNGARGAATLLLAAVVSALLVVANSVIGAWTDGHLLAAWVALWVVGFAALALLNAPLRRAGGRINAGFKAWRLARKQMAEDEKTWSLALTDAHMMADISRAMSRDARRDVRGFY
ncbi:hypothetical protein PY257_01765 [Ramlibacter sp. H39-3-26]|uniref:hypothetical protein n=1 Tax=Curvibacter soli TaxID=3031331 RepID=UPI0023DB9DB7|nr:hypothetical protein [Ramlibacter sp. H39-3-26]MDF1483923.1 hypothetical protein [Ramlibacter sp. H39-3-26]